MTKFKISVNKMDMVTGGTYRPNLDEIRRDILKYLSTQTNANESVYPKICFSARA